MKRKLIAFLLIQFCCGALLCAKDYSLIEQLPDKLAAAKKEGHKGWDTGNTGDMQEASYQYNSTLASFIKRLATAYYPDGLIKDTQVDDYLKALYTVHRFKQDADDPSGDFKGSMSGLDVASDVDEDLEKTITDMVQKITADDSKFNFKAWKKKWDAAQKTGD